MNLTALGRSVCPACKQEFEFEYDPSRPITLDQTTKTMLAMHLRGWLDQDACPNRCPSCRGDGQRAVSLCSGFGGERTYRECYECRGTGYRLPQPVPENVVLGEG